jgi:Na+-driven multidrug efflux pump
VQIQIAHLFGAGRLKEAYAASYRALGVGVLLVSCNALLLFFFGGSILRIFTTDSEIIHLTGTLFILNLVLQPAKMMNMALNNSLSAVGDTRFSMVTSLFSMWFVATLFSYIVGVHLGYGLVGVYCCMIADEYVRGFIALFRWRRKKYLKLAEQKAESTSRAVKTIGQISEII